MLIGGIPLMPERPVGFQPSFVDEPERRSLRDSRAIRLTVVEDGGHVLFEQFPALVVRVLSEMLGVPSPF